MLRLHLSASENPRRGFHGQAAPGHSLTSPDGLFIRPLSTLSATSDQTEERRTRTGRNVPNDVPERRLRDPGLDERRPHPTKGWGWGSAPIAMRASPQSPQRLRRVERPRLTLRARFLRRTGRSGDKRTSRPPFWATRRDPRSETRNGPGRAINWLGLLGPRPQKRTTSSRSTNGVAAPVHFVARAPRLKRTERRRVTRKIWELRSPFALLLRLAIAALY